MTHNNNNDNENQNLKSSKCNIGGVLTVFAGFILMFYNGSVFFVGNVEPYIYSFYPKSTISEAQSIMPLINLVTTLGNFVGSNMIKR